MGTPNKTTTEQISDSSILGFIDYKLANSDCNPMHQHSGWVRTATRFQGRRILKGKAASRAAQALAFWDWVKGHKF